MNSSFHAELDSYKNEVCWYGRFALGMLKSALSAFESGDEKIAADIIRQKEYLSNQYEMLNERGILLIALHQPMATDLRIISCCMDTAASSERVGRYAKDIAEVVKDSSEREFSELRDMGNMTVKILDAVYGVFESGDLAMLKDCIDIEDKIDSLYDEIYENCLKQTDSFRYAGAALLVNRYLERCADHACRMGEKVYYMRTGKRLQLKNIEV
ncbi:MAG: PhoU domain-containing protein [Methanocorpusculum sp.]|nr:PhoU domain-containing protein [Methanocorpusculum sp.]